MLYLLIIINIYKKYIKLQIEINFPSLWIYNCYYSFFKSILDMPTKKSKNKLTSNTIEANEEKETNPRTAKIVLFVFGLGPLILMCLFLFSNGFFNSP